MYHFELLKRYVQSVCLFMGTHSVCISMGETHIVRSLLLAETAQGKKYHFLFNPCVFMGGHSARILMGET